MSNDKMREEFEAAILQIAEGHQYRHIDCVLKRSRLGNYATAWVDSAWIGWQAALSQQLESEPGQIMGRVHRGKPGTFLHGGVYACLNSVGRRLPDGAPLYHTSPKPAAQVSVDDPIREEYPGRCQDCGRAHILDTSLPSDIWNQIADPVDMLCAVCIDKRLTEKGLQAEAEFYFVGESLVSKLYSEPAALPEGFEIARSSHDNDNEIRVQYTFPDGSLMSAWTNPAGGIEEVSERLLWQLANALLSTASPVLGISPTEKRQWVNMADQEPENDSIVWTRWDGMPDTEGRAPVTGEAAKSLTPYVRGLWWLDTGLRRPETPETGGADAG